MTIEEIEEQIIAAKEADSNLDDLDSDSGVAVWRLWARKVAESEYVLYGQFDTHKAEVGVTLATQKPHTLPWYVTMSKKFQYGDSLPADTDVYAVIDATKQIVANAAAEELDGVVRIKVAKVSSGSLAKLNPVGELPAFKAYMGRIKDAGVRLQLTSGDPDDLQLGLDVYYDPLIIDGTTGARLDGTAATPVKDAINIFLESLPFNGLFVLNLLIGHLQKIEGVRIGAVRTCQARYGVLAYADIEVEYTPDAGYMVLDGTHFDANVTYTAHGPI